MMGRSSVLSSVSIHFRYGPNVQSVLLIYSTFLPQSIYFLISRLDFECSTTYLQCPGVNGAPAMGATMWRWQPEHANAPWRIQPALLRLKTAVVVSHFDSSWPTNTFPQSINHGQNGVLARELVAMVVRWGRSKRRGVMKTWRKRTVSFKNARLSLLEVKTTTTTKSSATPARPFSIEGTFGMRRLSSNQVKRQQVVGLGVLSIT